MQTLFVLNMDCIYMCGHWSNIHGKLQHVCGDDTVS